MAPHQMAMSRENSSSSNVHTPQDLQEQHNEEEQTQEFLKEHGLKDKPTIMACTKAPSKFTRPPFLDWWQTYMAPTKLILDIALMIVNKKGWRVITKDWTEPHLFAYYAVLYSFHPDYMMRNDEFPIMVISSRFLMVFEVIDLFMICKYRKLYCKSWIRIAIHHIGVITAFSYFLVIGTFLPIASATMSFSHVFFLPTDLFRRGWKRFKSDALVWLVVVWSCGGLILMSILYLFFMYETSTKQWALDSLGGHRLPFYSALLFLINHYILFIQGSYIPVLYRRGMIGGGSSSSSSTSKKEKAF